VSDRRLPPRHANPDELHAAGEAGVMEALRRGNWEGAEVLVRKLLASSPQAPHAWALDSDVGLALGDRLRSLASARRAIELGAVTTHNYVRVARALRARGCWPEAESAIESARAAAENPNAYALLGEYYTQLEDYARARAAYDKAVTGDPANARYLYNRAAVRRFLGDLEAAESDYDRIIDLDPRDSEAWLNRSDLRTQTTARNHVRDLEKRFKRGFDSWQGEVPIRFALAKEYEDLGDYPQSWHHLTAGATLRRRHLQYDVTVDLATVDWIIEAFPADGPHGAGCRSAEPIFIVGMPRTGTTLLERILGGRPDVFAAGELKHFAVALVAAARRKAGRADLSRRDLVAISATIDFTALGSDYIERARPRTDRHARFTDKMPLNYLYCGLIRRALPNARILHLTRHPMATCYAVFKILFNQGYPFSYDLGELADYYIAYRRLMDHWHGTIPGQILDVSYERLVTEPERETRRVFDFCDLEWDAGCLDFHHRLEPTTTASAAQVRRPIYRSSVEIWRQYATELQPVADRLTAAGIALST
jgi:tetratricopeptide (TPR) repeat protein